jgi:hypothetical protein
MEKLNGAAAPPVMLRTPIMVGGGNRLVYTMSNGAYVGSIVFDGMTADLLRAMAQDFVAFINQQTGGLALAPASALGALPKRN